MATLTMQRVFDAPPVKVFEFLTRTENLLNWWGPEGTIIRDHSLDFSKVGPWFAVMIGPDGGSAKVGGQVVEVNAPHAIERKRQRNPPYRARFLGFNLIFKAAFVA